MCPGVRSEGWLRCSAQSFGVLSAWGVYSTLLLLPISGFCSWFFRSGSLGFFGLFVSFSTEFAKTAACRQLFLVQYGFFVFC